MIFIAAIMVLLFGFLLYIVSTKESDASQWIVVALFPLVEDEVQI